MYGECYTLFDADTREIWAVIRESDRLTRTASAVVVWIGQAAALCQILLWTNHGL